MFSRRLLSVRGASIRAWVLGPAACTTSLVIGFAATNRPGLFFGVLGVALGIGMLMRPIGRLAFAVFGGLVFLQGSNGAGKLIYLLAVLGCYAVALARLPQVFSRRPDLRIFRPLFFAAATFSLYLLGLFFVSHAHGIPTSDYFRDVAPYLLLAVLPTLAIDGAETLREGQFTALILAAGAIASLALVVAWLDRRGIGTLSVAHLAFASFPLAIVTFCYCLARIPNRRTGVIWALAGMLIYACILITGTRGALLLMLVFGGLMGSRAKSRLPLGKLAAAFVIVGAGLVLLLPIAANALLRDPQYLETRFAGVKAALYGTGSLSTDRSLLQRREQTSAAFETWRHYPLLGSGPGYSYNLSRDNFINTNTATNTNAKTFNLDTPMITPAKIGALGTVMLFAYVAHLCRTITAHRRLVGYSPAVTCARLYGLAVLISVPLGSAAEDKGNALAVMLLIANISVRRPTSAANVTRS